jgi:hypothetical protein
MALRHLDSDACAKVLRATRRESPGIPISLTTSAAIVEDPARRLGLVSSWTELPDLVTANQGEEGIIQLCELLMSRGVEIEAGLLSVDDARKFVAAPIHQSLGCYERWSQLLLCNPPRKEAVYNSFGLNHLRRYGLVCRESLPYPNIVYRATPLPFGHRLRVDPVAASQCSQTLLTMSYCSTDRLCRCGAPV